MRIDFQRFFNGGLHGNIYTPSIYDLVSRKFCLLIIEGTHPSPPNLMATEKYLAIIKN
jgi:hypothetical protein